MGALTPARIDVLGDKNRRSIKRDGDPELQPRDRVDALGGSLLVAYYAARNAFKIPESSQRTSGCAAIWRRSEWSGTF